MFVLFEDNVINLTQASIVKIRETKILDAYWRDLSKLSQHITKSKLSQHNNSQESLS